MQGSQGCGGDLLRSLLELRPALGEQRVEGGKEVLEEVAVLRRVHDLDRVADLRRRAQPLLRVGRLILAAAVGGVSPGGARAEWEGSGHCDRFGGCPA